MKVIKAIDTCTDKAYYIASGRYAGRLKIAEGDTRKEAIENWCQMLPNISQAFRIVS